MAEKLEVFVQKLNDFIDNTQAYRHSQEETQRRIADELKANQQLMFRELKDIRDKLFGLPCEQRYAFGKGLLAQINAIWMFIVGIVLAIVGVGIATFLKK